MIRPERQCRFRLFTATEYPNDKEAFDRFWDAMSESIVGAERYDSNEEPLLNTYEPDSTRAFDLLQQERFLYVAGQRGFLSSMWADERVNSIRVYLDHDELEGDRGRDWVDWFLRLSSHTQLLFGEGCSTQEYDAKHGVIRELPSGGQVRSSVGVSKAEFERYLPGIYWLTIFGEVLAARLPFANLAPLPVITTNVGNRLTAVRIDEPVIPADMTARLALEAKIADALGPTLFFDRHRPDVQFEHLPEFRAELERLT